MVDCWIGVVSMILLCAGGEAISLASFASKSVPVNGGVSCGVAIINSEDAEAKDLASRPILENGQVARVRHLLH